MADDIFGIDLGTTYSAIAHINDLGQPEVILNREGDPTTPSVVYFESDQHYVVGKEAKNGAVLNSDSTIALIKRHMGTQLALEYFGKTYSPESISALILKDLVEYARDATGLQTNKVVITVPAYFGITEKAATRQAGEIAGLEVVGIVTEPVAAALSVGIRGEEARTLFVYDLGGGTFDCTVMQVASDRVDVIAIDGNRRLGGADWDTRLFDLAAKKFVDQASLDEDPTADEDFAQRLLTEVEDAKKTLSRRDKTSLMLSYGDAREKVEVSRTEFEEATRSLVEETLDIVRRTMAKASEKAQEQGFELVLDEVLLVGGSSRMPMIEASLEQEMGWTLRKTELDLAVAKGAAIYGQGEPIAEGTADDVGASDGEDGEATTPQEKRLQIGGKTVTISNVLSKGLGVKFIRDAAGGGSEHHIWFLAHPNDKLPLVASTGAATYAEGQTEIEINIFEQDSAVESERVEDNREVTPATGSVISSLPNLPKGSPIEFDLAIDTEGNAVVTAFEPASGQRLQLEVRISVLQQDEVDKATQIVAGLSRRE